ncbi:N-acetylmuramoyl-L-alanine amidase [Terrihalobacillus insolitus]|uniref:N-acetylmuramoyl-L-alanine amidase n=1 Tax=Terrihalobacillus insolitus TaxID=2950438 RepID=UPI002341AB02|nr:N-acetylmuramoyl-L-alanine amidase [Terrihalobacillus insolitus]MDC3412426.1 N-acetylmuramoyl-L-alanine amidase [Terrihalobacillus insolitus]
MKRKQISFFLVLVFFLVLTITTVVYAKNAIINVDNLNVRSGPGLSYEVIGQVNQDETYPILDQYEDWVQIETGDFTGWVTKEFLTIPEGKKEENETSITLLYNKTNVRSGPTTADEIIGYADKGSQFEVVREISGWYQIKWEGKTGYIAGWLVEKDAETFPYEETSLTKKTIVIDVGHGGRDVGAINLNNAVEKDFTMRTAKELQNQLQLLGVEVIMTRNTDTYISLSGRASLSNVVQPDAFISIHYNSAPAYPSASGISTFYLNPTNETLANDIQSELIKATGKNDRGVQQEDFQVLRQTHQPAVLLELGFISNEASERDFLSRGYQEKLAKGIINGLMRYFSN